MSTKISCDCCLNEYDRAKDKIDIRSYMTHLYIYNNDSEKRYTASLCPSCGTKIIRLLIDNNISFSEKNISRFMKYYK